MLLRAGGGDRIPSFTARMSGETNPAFRSVHQEHTGLQDAPRRWVRALCLCTLGRHGKKLMPRRSSRVTSLLALLEFLVLAVLVFRGFRLAPTTNTLARAMEKRRSFPGYFAVLTRIS
jgi:hypothetical protein